MWPMVQALGAACLKREGLVFAALIALIAGCAVQTVLLGWIISILHGSGATEPLARIAYGLVATEAIVFISMSMLLGRRSIAVKVGTAEITASGGDVDVTAREG
jgi:hypothetical protein